MRRRTNLFYTNTDEANFLTFSNYPEHLTGVSLSLNHKLFPSKFICMNIPKLNQSDKNDADTCAKCPHNDICSNVSCKQCFINNFLSGYYENKLAVLRDVIVNSDSELSINHPDQKMNYLGYLIDAIKKFDEDASIVYVSDITEQDYNGTFTDIICTIDSSSEFVKTWTLSESENESNEIIELTSINTKHLYGWAMNVSNNEYIYFGPNHFINLEPIFDDTLNVSDNTNQISIEYVGNIENYSDENLLDIDESFKNKIGIYNEKSNYNMIIKDVSNGTITDITFNVIIPLYDVVNIDLDTNDTHIEEETSIDLHETPNNGDYVKNVPYGMWFANKPITLTRDNYTKYAPSWSLLIGTQFKPFPNSSYLYQDQNNSSSIGHFSTMAQIMERQSYIYNMFEDNMITLNNMYSYTSYNVNHIKEIVNSLEQSLNTISYSYITDMISTYISNLTNVTNQLTYNLNWVNK